MPLSLPRRAWPLVPLVCLAIALASAVTGFAQAASTPLVPFETYTLSNGMRVILHVDRKLPIVHVNQWFHVGSKNERPGRTGFAHLFEHLMFEGSEHHNAGYFPPLQRGGARLNGETKNHPTKKRELVPTGALDRARWIE